MIWENVLIGLFPKVTMSPSTKGGEAVRGRGHGRQLGNVFRSHGNFTLMNSQYGSCTEPVQEQEDS